MNVNTLAEIKEQALLENIPIIMDDTLAVIAEYLKKEPPCKILEIGTAVRLFSNLLFTISKAGGKHRYD